MVSLTLLTTLLDFTDVGEIRVYIDKNFVEKREKQLEKGGLVPGGELASAFSSLRANDLVWSYVVNNYLKGKQPPAFDLLYWNSDATNLPGPMYAYYLRNTYQDNKLAQARRAHDVRRAREPEAREAADLRVLGARGPHRAVEGRLQERAHARRQGEVHRSAPRATSRARSIRPRRTSAATGPTTSSPEDADAVVRQGEGDAGQLVARRGRSG